MAIVLTLNTQVGAARAASLTYLYTYSDRAGKVIVSTLPPLRMKGRHLVLRGVRVGSRSSVATYHSEPVCIGNKELLRIVYGVSIREGVNPSLVRAIIQTESDFRVKAKSQAGAMGLMQLMPSTARRFGVLDIFNPYQNITGGVKYLKCLSNLFKGDISKVIAAYNAGETAVMKYKGLPPFAETRAYVPLVLRRCQDYMMQSDGYFNGQVTLSRNSSSDSIAAVEASMKPLTNSPGVFATRVHDHNSSVSVCVYHWTNSLGRPQITDYPPPHDGS